MFDFLYETDERDREIFGDAYCPPEKFEHGQWHTVARYEKDDEGGDGQPVEIDECRMPARFFRLRALPSTNSVNEPVAPFCLSSGSGDEVGRLFVQLAKAITRAMVGLGNAEER